MNRIHLNDPGRKSWKTWKSTQKIVIGEKLVHNVVMDEELIQNGVMDELMIQNCLMDVKFMKNFVMCAKIGPKVVMDLSVFKIGGWNILQPVIENCRKIVLMRMSRNCRSEFKAEIHSFVIQYLEQPFVCDNLDVKESKPICEDLHEMMQCYGQQHFAARDDLHEHLRRHSWWKDSLKMECSQMRSTSTSRTWNGKAFLIHLESYLEECAQEVWERNRMSPDMHTTWWNVKIRKLMEMLVMVFREQSEEDDQMNTVRKPVILIPETLREWEPTLRERGAFWE